MLTQGTVLCVAIVPTTGSVEDWMAQGQNSEWTKTLVSVLIEWDGAN